MSARLPVHGFVLAGGRSSRMGEDKALLRFCGRPMVEIAVEKLRAFCAEVGIAGNREDLEEFAMVVRETRVDVGPAAGIEAGLGAASQPWVMFIPVDVPLVPVELLRRWAEEAMARGEGGGLAVSSLWVGRDQPSFCMLRREWGERFSAALDGGERRLSALFDLLGQGESCHWVYNPGEMFREDSQVGAMIERYFLNVNTPQELAEAEAWISRHTS